MDLPFGWITLDKTDSLSISLRIPIDVFVVHHYGNNLTCSGQVCICCQDIDEMILHGILFHHDFNHQVGVDNLMIKSSSSEWNGSVCVQILYYWYRTCYIHRIYHNKKVQKMFLVVYYVRIGDGYLWCRVSNLWFFLVALRLLFRTYT